MGIFDFNRDSGEAFKNDGPDARQFDQHLQEKLKRYNYQVEGLTIHHENGEVTISGQAPDQDTREKVILALGNSKGVHRVNDQMKVRKQDTAAQKQTTASEAQYTSSETDYKTGSSEEVGGSDYKGPSTTGIHQSEGTATNKKDGKKATTARKDDDEEELVQKPVAKTPGRKGKDDDEELVEKPVAKKRGKDDDEELVEKPVAKKKGKDDDEELVEKPVAKGRKGGDDDDDEDLVHKPVAKGQRQNQSSTTTENIPTKKEAPPGYKGPVARTGSNDDDDLVEKPQFYTVEDGDDLDKIASKHYGDSKHHQKIIEANNPMLTKSSELYPGQVLRVPRSNRESD